MIDPLPAGMFLFFVGCILYGLPGYIADKFWEEEPEPMTEEQFIEHTMSKYPKYKKINEKEFEVDLKK